MKKYFNIRYFIVIICVLALSGCGNKNVSKENSEQNNSGTSVTEKVKQSLYDLVATGAGMKCTLEDPKSGPMTMYVKGEKAKVEGFDVMGGFSGPVPNEQPKKEKGTMINDGTWVYIWSGTEGMKFNIKDMENLAPKEQNQDNPQENASDWKDWVKQMDSEGIKYDCNPSVLSDSDFTPPSNVKFQDLGEMMKGLMKIGENMKNNAPSQ